MGSGFRDGVLFEVFIVFIRWILLSFYRVGIRDVEGLIVGLLILMVSLLWVFLFLEFFGSIFGVDDRVFLRGGVVIEGVGCRYCFRKALRGLGLI